jgi:DNA-binding NtrC family response regulator
MPLMSQAKLLRFLDGGELQRVGENKPIKVDVRVIAATQKHLEKYAAEGRFRSDLYFRLAAFPLIIPSLAEHREDIPELASHFLGRLALDQPAKKLHPSAMERLLVHGIRPGKTALPKNSISSQKSAVCLKSPLCSALEA